MLVYVLSTRVGISITMEQYANWIFQIRDGEYNLLNNFFYEPVFGLVLLGYGKTLASIPLLNRLFCEEQARFVPLIVFCCLLILIFIKTTDNLNWGSLYFHSMIVLDPVLTSLPWHLIRTFVAVIVSVYAFKNLLSGIISERKFLLFCFASAFIHWSFWLLVLLAASSYIYIKIKNRKILAIIPVLCAALVMLNQYLTPYFEVKLFPQLNASLVYAFLEKVTLILQGKNLGSFAMVLMVLLFSLFAGRNVECRYCKVFLYLCGCSYIFAYFIIDSDPILNRCRTIFYPIALYAFCFIQKKNYKSLKIRSLKVASWIFMAGLYLHSVLILNSYQSRISFWDYGYNF